MTDTSEAEEVRTPASGDRRDIATHLTIVGLLVALVFNTIGVWGQWRQQRAGADAAKEARFYAQLGVLTQLASDTRASDRAIASGKLNDLRCRRDYQRSDMSRKDQNSLERALDVYEVMAWAFNQKLAPDTARQLWAPRMVDLRTGARKLESRQEVSANWPELDIFDATGVKKLPNPCP